MIIDKTKEEFSDVPTSLDGEILLERVKDAEGNPHGFVTMDPGHCKWMAENMTEEELVASGHGKNLAVFEDIKGKANISAKVPRFAQGA